MMREDGSLFSLDFSRKGDSQIYLGQGWAAASPGGRWTSGGRSSLEIPGISADGDATLRLSAKADGDMQSSRAMNVYLNDILLAEFQLVGVKGFYSTKIPKEAIDAGHNVLRMAPIGRDELATFVFDLSISRGALGLYDKPLPTPLRPAEATSDRGALAGRFESLGCNCEFGLFQRLCGAEPIGLLRFASIRAGRLIEGLERQFAGIGDLDKLTFDALWGGTEHIGQHSFYGLFYHTFRNVGEVEPAAFALSESRRLPFVARILLEQIRGARKIFVVQRRLPNLTLAEVVALFDALRKFNENVKLLYVVEGGPASYGVVECVAPGLFRGYIDRLAPGDNAPDLSFDRWLEICRACDGFVNGPEVAE